MKIVQVLPPLTKGGGEKMAVDLANFLAGEGHELTILAAYPVDPELLQRAIVPEVEVRFILARGSRLRPYLAMLPWMARNRAWLASRDVLHVHLTFGAAFGTMVRFFRRLAGRRRPAVVETYHAVGTPIPRLDRKLHRWMAARRDGLALMAEDDHWTRFVAAHPRVRSAVIPNGIALDEAKPDEAAVRAYREAAGIPADALVVGTVGRLVTGRRPELFIPLFAAIARAMGEKVHFLLAGEGPLTDSLRASAKQAGLEGRVHFPGLVMRPVLPFSIIDLYVSLNVGPITGIAALEAAAFGLPIVSVQLREGHRPGAADWIFSSTDPEALAREAVRLLQSGDARRDLAARQREHVRRHHGVETMARAYLSLYRAALGEESGDQG